MQGDRDHAAIVLAGGKGGREGEVGGPAGLRGPVSRLHRAGYHTVGGVR